MWNFSLVVPVFDVPVHWKQSLIKFSSFQRRSKHTSKPEIQWLDNELTEHT